MPNLEWALWDRFEKALCCLAYRKAPNVGVAADAVDCHRDTISKYVELAGVPLKKFKRGGEMPPQSPEVLRLLEIMEAAAGITGTPPVAVADAPAPAGPGPSAPANAAPESASILVALEPEPGAKQKVTGVYANLEVTVSVRKSEPAGAQSALQ
ncbi:MAG TPA: hypothetical protein VGF13_11200 [Verrucomicrobiae bacterium]